MKITVLIIVYDENQSLSKRAISHAILSLVRLSSSPAPLRQRLGAGADIERGSHAYGMGTEVQGAHTAAGQTHIRHAGGTVGRGKEFKSELWFKLQGSSFKFYSVNIERNGKDEKYILTQIARKARKRF